MGQLASIPQNLAAMNLAGQYPINAYAGGGGAQGAQAPTTFSSPAVNITITNPTTGGPMANPAMASLATAGGSNAPGFSQLATLPNFMSPVMPLVNGAQHALVKLYQDALNSAMAAQASNVKANADAANYMSAVRQAQSQAPNAGPSLQFMPSQPFPTPPSGPPMMPPQPGPSPFAFGPPPQPFNPPFPPGPPTMPFQPGPTPFSLGQGQPFNPQGPPPPFQMMPGMPPGRLPLGMPPSGPPPMPAMAPPPGYPRSFNPGPTPQGPSVGPSAQGPQQPAASPIAETNKQGNGLSFQSMTVNDLNQVVSNPPSFDAKLNALEELSMRDNVNAETYELLKKTLSPNIDPSHLSGAERMQAIDAQRAAALALSLLDGRLNAGAPTKDLPGFKELKETFYNKVTDPQAKAAVIQGLRLLHRPQDPEIKSMFEKASESDDVILKQLGQAGLENKPFAYTQQ